MRKSSKILKIKAFTWSKDSHGLFDYENNHLTTNKGICKQNLHIYRNAREVILLDSNTQGSAADLTNLCNIKMTDDGQFLVSPADDSLPLNLVIRSLKSNGHQKGYELNAGDRVKIGRLEYFVREVRKQDGIVRKAASGPLSLNYKNVMSTEREGEQENELEKPHCRICFSGESEDGRVGSELKFLTPCKCKGTSSYIHFSCLCNWLESKKITQKPNLPLLQNSQTTSETFLTQIHNQLLSLGASSTENFTDILNGLVPLHLAQALADSQSVRLNSNQDATAPQSQGQSDMPQQNNVKNHIFSNFCCDVCHQNLPYLITTDKGSEYATVDIPRPDKEPYLLFERLSQGKEQKIFSVINGVSDHQIKLGRGHTSGIVIPDISVSRFHAFIKYQNGGFYLFDKNSKFGTLVQLPGPLKVQMEKVGIQCGRTLITFTMREEKMKDERLPGMRIGSIPNTTEETKVAASQNNKKLSNPKKKVEFNLKSVENDEKKEKTRDGESEGTLDVEEIAPPFINDLNRRSKKIKKGNSRTSNK